MLKYIPVAVATSGLKPTIMNPEPNTIPGARPQKAENTDPKNAQIITAITFFGLGMKSPSLNS